MPLPLRNLLLCLLCLAVSPCPAASPWSQLAAGEPLAAYTTDGRVLRGDLDPRSTDAVLCLSVDAAGVTISSATPAALVARVEQASPVALPPVWHGGVGPELLPFHPDRSTWGDAVVRSLEVLAAPGSWDADPQIDGLRLWVRPRGADGGYTNVAGSLRCELRVESGDPRTHQRGFAVTERWRRELTLDDYGPEGAVVELPYSRLRPEQRSEFPRLGVLSVRMVVPGEGVIDALVTDVPLAAPSFNRDRNQLLTGQRYFPGEAH
ncbi:hypothetical protein Pla175_37960 [Pirellulimonas nuda]|uniref:Uncharacterized protein n=1 Tax=Pirellulimonas nuda TaxID=2528009 RepID=A0A518DG29_9BACT|nr:hypothetical protein [Pirellulimonas nuda]QDU90392.1 hypothetical protein Pla175_37960 [Pirellulimonas nuda]